MGMGRSWCLLDPTMDCDFVSTYNFSTCKFEVLYKISIRFKLIKSSSDDLLPPQTTKNLVFL